MAIEIINVGASPNDGNGDPIRDAFIKCNDNFDELETTKISGSGTDDYIPKFNGPDAIQNSQIFDNGTNVGIGTNTPSSTLQVGNGIGIKNIFISGAGNNLALGGLSVSFLGFSSGTISTINTSGSVPLGVGTRSTQPLVLGTNNAERMRIASSGNVLIGTTSDAGNKLEVIGTANNWAGSITGSTTTGQSYGAIVRGGTNSSDIAFNVNNASNSTTYLNVRGDGNVGIGTTSPSEKLHVVGIGLFQSTAYTNAIFDGTNSTDWGNNIAFRSQGTNFGFIGSIGSLLGSTEKDMTIWATSGNGFRIYTNASERMRITSAGNVGIGTTSPSSSAILHLRSSSQGFLPPVMRTGDRNSISSPAIGLVIFNEDSQTIEVYTTAGWKSLLY